MKFSKMHKNTIKRCTDPNDGSSQSKPTTSAGRSLRAKSTASSPIGRSLNTKSSATSSTATTTTTVSLPQDDSLPSPKPLRRVSFSDSGNNEIISDTESDSSLRRFEDELMDFLESTSQSSILFQTNYNVHNSAPNTTETKIEQEQKQSSDLRKSSLEETKDSSSDKKLVVALYDFRARSNDDLGFSKGDCLELIKNTDSDWWLACDGSGNVGYIPSNFVAEVEIVETEPWFFDNITRMESDILLMTPPNCHGSFLIRLSASRHMEYSLSVRNEDIVNHYRIKYSDIGWFYISRQKHFPTLKKLVEFYCNNLSGMCCRLGTPCIRQVNEMNSETLSYCRLDTWEIQREQIELTQKLATGNFGEVYKGVWNKTTEIAVKTLKKGTTTEREFLAEAQVMKKLRHPKLIQLYGICSDCEPFYIVTEFMKYGSLDKYLKVYRHSINLKDRLIISSQVASGMAYLESQNFIHRDLAARNVLVGDRLTCKIADFGLSRILQETEYLALEGTRFPIKWTAPEALFYSTFSIKSDVWSYGILLFEVFTNGDIPYPELSNQQVVQKISNGYRMNRPQCCPTEIYTLMMKCWDVDPHLRPSFNNLWQTMESFCLVLHK